MSKRLEILKNSLAKKEAAIDSKLNEHFASVKAANGQPLNDKRGGHAVMNKWEKQSDAIRAKMASIEVTKNAIERETGKLLGVALVYAQLPKDVTDLIDAGTLKQWSKHPRFLFVDGVEKARIAIDLDNGKVTCSYVKSIPTKEQFELFRDVFNFVRASMI
jgi:hypothetical protein